MTLQQGRLSHAQKPACLDSPCVLLIWIRMSGTGTCKTLRMQASRNTILLFDDDLNHGAAAVSILEYAGYVVHFCSTGSDGLAEAQAWLPKLIILDFQLPDIRGAEVGRAIRSDPLLRHIPILMNSSHDVAVVCKEFSDYDHFLRKPFGYDEFLSVIDRLTKTTRIPTA